MKIISKCTIALLLTAVSLSAESKEFEYPISADLQSTTLKVHKITRDVEIVAIDENVIRLHMEGMTPLPEKAKGMRPLFSNGTDNTGLGLELSPSEEDANVLVLTQARRNPGKKLLIEVPRALSVHITTPMNEDVSVVGVAGEIAVTTLNGEIELEDVTGPLLINSTNSKINVTLSELNQEFPSSVATINGEVDITFNESAKADLQLSVMHGEIYTDLDLETDDNEKNGMEHFMGKNERNAKLNGGGVQFSVSTINGEIYLRKGK